MWGDRFREEASDGGQTPGGGQRWGTDSEKVG